MKGHKGLWKAFLSSSRMTHTSSTAQGGFKDRKPIGEVGCCDARMAERTHWWTESWLRVWVSLSDLLCLVLSSRSLHLPLSLFISCQSICVSISLTICLDISLSPSLTLYPIELYPSLSPLPLPLPLLSIYIYIFIYLSIGRTQYFATFLPFRALLSSFYWLSLSLSFSLTLTLTLSLLTLSLTFLTTVAASVHTIRRKVDFNMVTMSGLISFPIEPTHKMWASQTSPLQQSPWYMFQLDTISRHVYPTYPMYPVHPAYPIMFKFDMSNSWAGAKFFASNEYEKNNYPVWYSMNHDAPLIVKMFFRNMTMPGPPNNQT